MSVIGLAEDEKNHILELLHQRDKIVDEMVEVYNEAAMLLGCIQMAPGEELTGLPIRPSNKAVLEEILKMEGDDVMSRNFWRLMFVCFDTPRPSTNYDGTDKPERSLAIRAALKNVATIAGLKYSEDSALNVVLRNFDESGSSPKNNKGALVAFQGHMDVVVSKNDDVVHNFETDGVDVRIVKESDITQSEGSPKSTKGDESPCACSVKPTAVPCAAGSPKVGASSEPLLVVKPVKGTTLGADNGVGVAGAIAALYQFKGKYKLEALITANEETNFSGASGLDASHLSAKMMLNLDSEEPGRICVGSAGGFVHISRVHLPKETSLNSTCSPKGSDKSPKSSSSSSYSSVKISIKGCKGGHSGVDIHRGRLNAIKALTEVLVDLSAFSAHKGQPMRLKSFHGGTAANAIPREASCEVLVSSSDVKLIEDLISKSFAAILNEHESIDCSEKNAKIALEWSKEKPTAEAVSSSASPAQTVAILDFAMSVRSGMAQRSPQTLDVQSSMNLGKFEFENGLVSTTILPRSTKMSWLDRTRAHLDMHSEGLKSRLGVGATCEIECERTFDGWEPDLKSDVLAALKSSYRKIHDGALPVAYTVHAGLECCTIMKAFEKAGRSLQIASIGPDCRGAHSPDECLYLASVRGYCDWIKSFTEELAKKAQ